MFDYCKIVIASIEPAYINKLIGQRHLLKISFKEQNQREYKKIDVLLWKINGINEYQVVLNHVYDKVWESIHRFSQLLGKKNESKFNS